VTTTKFKTKVKSLQKSLPLARVRAITTNKILLLQVEPKQSAGTLYYGSSDILLFIYSTTELLFMNSSQVRKFHKLHNIKLLPFDNCRSTFDARQIRTIGHHCASISELFLDLYKAFISSRQSIVNY